MANERSDRGTHGQDVGKTMGGGSLGHDQPYDPADKSAIRNQRDERTPQDDETKDPVMPDDSSTLNTKI